jgi:tripartite-type tricarboxylate transporter receptor subunit TctC
MMQPQIFRHSLRVLLLALATMALGSSAQTWPDRPIKLVVPFPPGGGADMAARTYGEKLSTLLGQPVLIDNKPGASGNIGAELVARAPTDGYTLLFANEFLATNPLMFKVASNAAAIAVHPGLGVKTIQELIALGRTKNLNYASPGYGTGPHLFGQLIAMQTGAKFTNIPYKGSAPATADAVGGQVDFIISTLSPMVQHLNSGRLRGLAVTGNKRSAQAPDVPTLGESGLLGQRYEVWYGVVAPAAVPRPIITRLQQASAQVLRDPELLNKLRNAGYDVEPSIGDDFGAELRTDIDRWVRVIRDAKIPRE